MVMIMMMRTKREEREGLGVDGLMNKCSKARVGGGTMHTFVFFQFREWVAFNSLDPMLGTS